MKKILKKMWYEWKLERKNQKVTSLGKQRLTLKDKQVLLKKEIEDLKVNIEANKIT